MRQISDVSLTEKQESNHFYVDRKSYISLIIIYGALLMADSNKDKSISNRSDGDKTKVVKSQNKDNNKVNKRNLKTEGNFKSNSTRNENSSQFCNDAKNAINNQNSIKPASTSDGSSLLGKVIKNRYEIESLIGHGGLCDVYLAKDIILDSSGADNPHVALKLSLIHI